MKISRYFSHYPIISEKIQKKAFYHWCPCMARRNRIPAGIKKRPSKEQFHARP
jgi:hypothetical protein